MDYFSIVNLEKEPFSNSPDPDFFYGSGQHLDCLQKLELALRLRRGLNVVIGEVGTGKTTLCRQLIRRFDASEEFETHLILDPHFAGPTEFLQGVSGMLTGKKPSADASDWQLKEAIKNYLFERGVDENRTVILIIDEGQKLPSYCLELLREFLNYETNEYKLLQIVIFAQKEFAGIIDDHANFGDRINLYHRLKPMSFKDTRALIRFRLEKSSTGPETFTFFTWPALVMIYTASGGYPRKIIHLCHRCILTMIIQNRTVVDLLLVRTCIQRSYIKKPRSRKRAVAAVAAAVLIVVAAAAVLLPRYLAGHPEFARWSSPVEQAAISPPKVQRKIEAPPQAPPSPSRQSPTAEDAATRQPLIAPEGKPVSLSTAPDTAASDPAATQNAEAPRFTDYENVLGTLTVERNETLSGLIEQVYGTFNARYFKLLILANPEIENPDRITVGQNLVLPAIPARQPPKGLQGWWVLLAEKDSLRQAFAVLRDLPRNAPPVRMIPYWNPQKGTRFALVYPRHFATENSAAAYLKKLPDGLAADASVERLPAGQSVYFADPLFSRMRG